MKVIIAGCRHIEDFDLVLGMAECFPITEVVSGGAKGVDYLGEVYASSCGIPLKKFSADWNKHGKAAGPIRNGEMAEYADALIAIWDGRSKGTKDMINKAFNKGLKVAVYMDRDL